MNIDRETITKVMAMYGSSVVGIILGFSISIFNTSILGKEAFGDYKFIETVFRFIASLVSVGIFISITRMLAITKDNLFKHNLIGFFVLSLIAASFIGIILLIAFSYLEPIFFSNNLGHIIRKYAFIIFAILGNISLGEVLKGLNKIYTLAILNSIPAAAYLILANMYNNYNTIYLEDVLLIYYGLGLIFLIFIVFRLKPKFNIDKSLFKAVLNENSTNGRPIYYGSLAGVATTNIAGFTISYFLNNTQVGFYTLAMTVCSPLLIVPSVLGTTFFKKFATSEFIPKKVFLFSIIATIIALLIFFLFIEKVFLLFYSKDYFPVINIAKVLIFGFMLHGYGDLINRFLGARGKGKILRNVAFMVGFVNILGYLILVKYFGVMGAIITSIVASGLYLLMMYYYYLKFTKKYKYV